MQGSIGNLFEGIAAQADAEITSPLAEGHGVRIERIVSTGQASPPGFWYDQDWDEWVLVVAGQAVLEFADGEKCRLRTGDHILIPAGCRHRVDWTDPAAPTIWLAVHYGLDRARPDASPK